MAGEQARREVLERQFEFQRLVDALDRIRSQDIVIVETPRLTPLAFPIWAEFIQSRLTTKDWLSRITDMARALESQLICDVPINADSAGAAV